MEPREDQRPAIACRQLTKAYDTGTVALQALTLTIRSGVSFGLLGENGAGKSTLMRLLMGFILPTSGELRVLGERVAAHAHPQVGYLHEQQYGELRLTGRRYLTYMAQLCGLWGPAGRQRVGQTLDEVDLSTAADSPMGAYSKGMLQRLGIAAALLPDPDVLILDEPTSGLDPYSQWRMREIIGGLRRRGKTLLLCSHYLAEVQALCDEVAILQQGRLICHGAVADLLRADDLVEVVLAGAEPAASVAARLGLTDQVIKATGATLRLPTACQAEVLAALVAAGAPLQSLNPLSRTLEDVYIAATRPSGLTSDPAREASVLPTTTR